MSDQALAAPTTKSGPRRLFTLLADLEAVTWALLLGGMFLKYVTDTTEVGVRIGGMLHGVVFIAFALVTVLTWVDQKWTVGRLVLGLVSAIVPFMTVWFALRIEKVDPIDNHWRLRSEGPANIPERPVAWLLRNPLLGVLVLVVAVFALTALALAVGPPGK